MRAILTTALLATVMSGTLAPVVDAQDRAGEALLLCEQAEQVPIGQRATVFERGLALAEEAVAADRDNARAHFAVFCHLGKRMQLEGITMRTVRGLGRLRREIDTTLALDPSYPDALIGKGALLLSLPWFLGGDREEAERYLVRALEIAPHHAQGQLYLARALAARGGRETARAATEPKSYDLASGRRPAL
jgi:hypothetical protein